jgi:hypothetical protein
VSSCGLFQLSMFASRAGSTFAQDLVDYIDHDQLVEVVHKYVGVYPHLFIPLLWQLAYGRPERRRKLAAKLYQDATIACRQSEGERDDILRAFADLDERLAKAMAQEIGVNFPEPEPPEEDDDIDLNRPLLDNTLDDEDTKE